MRGQAMNDTVAENLMLAIRHLTKQCDWAEAENGVG